MKKRYRVALLSAPLFSNNMGCNALTYGSLDVLSEAAKKLGVEFEYCLVGNPADGVIPDELESHSMHFIKQLPDFSPKGLLRAMYRHNLQDRRREIGMLKDADIFCDNAWGDSFSDIYGQMRFDMVHRKLTYALRSGKPLILLPQTIGPFKSDHVKTKAAAILNSASAVYARDPLSVKCAQEICPGLEVFETIDVALFMDYSKRAKSSSDGLTVGINPSGLLWKGGYTCDNQFGLNADYQDVVRSLIKHLLSIEGVNIELIGHDILGPNAGDGCDDYYVCKCLQREFPECRVGPFFYSPVEAKSYISGLDLLIGSRMHCCIAAYSSGVPVFPLAYSRKFTGLFTEKLGYEHLSDLKTADCEAVLSGLKAFLCQLTDINKEFADRLKILDNYKTEMIDHLSALLVGML